MSELPLPEKEAYPEIEIGGQLDFGLDVKEVKGKSAGFKRKKAPTPFSRAELQLPELPRFNTRHYVLPELTSSRLDISFQHAFTPYLAKKSDNPAWFRSEPPKLGKLDYRYVPSEQLVATKGEKRKRVFVNGFDPRIQEGYYSESHIIGLANLASPRPINICEIAVKNNERLIFRHWPTTLQFSISTWIRARDLTKNKPQHNVDGGIADDTIDGDLLLLENLLYWAKDSRRQFNTYKPEGMINLYFMAEMLQGMLKSHVEIQPVLEDGEAHASGVDFPNSLLLNQ